MWLVLLMQATLLNTDRHAVKCEFMLEEKKTLIEH